MRMESTVIAEICRSDLESLAYPSTASITNVRSLSSYNWVEASTPTIVVPGSPPLWSPPKDKLRVKKDSGIHYVNQNAARNPKSPLEPLFRALYITNPSFDIRSIDVVTDRNNIRKLLSFVSPSTSPRGYGEFTINVEIIKNTALFCRDATNSVEFVDSKRFIGYGHEFEKEFTIDRIKGNTGHHRIISYSFGGLNFIIRHETDAYLGTESYLSTPLSGPTEQQQVQSRSKLAIRHAGEAVPLESTIEIKTRASQKRIDISATAAQLWVSQTPKLIRAYHNQGVFQIPDVEDVAAKIREWERKNKAELRQLAAVIRRILEVAKGCDGNVEIKYDQSQDKLVIWKVSRKMSLPQDLYSKWD
ncbi:hypothetical protein F4776DRAFT_632098 [Hypoxylon sp. NC0597]|nr:hypothetical protein F4776DRAFT_632098 [Hypoxylon sp. NC0597]